MREIEKVGEERVQEAAHVEHGVHSAVAPQRHVADGVAPVDGRKGPAVRRVHPQVRGADPEHEQRAGKDGDESGEGQDDERRQQDEPVRREAVPVEGVEHCPVGDGDRDDHYKGKIIYN